jgi:DNA-binding transcriptional LysR family regulator
MDWDKLKTFHAAAEAGSLTGAAELLNLSQSAVSRQISALETDLGVKLFHRHTRGLLLTEPGRVLFEAAVDVSARVTLADSNLQDLRDEPSGALRVTAPTAFGAIWLAPRLAKFSAAYPQIRLKLVLADHELDVSNLETDIAIRPWGARQNDVIQRKLMEVDQHLYGSAAYFARKGEPGGEETLDEHDFVAYGPRHLAPIPKLNWALSLGRDAGAGPRDPVIEINTIAGMVKAVEAGLGLAGLPSYVANDDDKLVRVLPEVTGPAFEIFVLYPQELKGSRRVAAFGDFIRSEARLWRDSQS